MRPSRQVLERQALVPFLKRQRWFGVEVARDSPGPLLRLGHDPQRRQPRLPRDGLGELHRRVGRNLPGARWPSSPASRTARISAEAPTAVLARITGARKGAIIDGFLDDDTCNRMLGLIEHRKEQASAKGRRSRRADGRR